MSERDGSENLPYQVGEIPSAQISSHQFLSENSSLSTTKFVREIVTSNPINLIRQSLSPWIIWAIATFFLFLQFLLQATSAVIVKMLMRDLDLTSIGAGILSSAFFYAYILWLIPAGLMLDRYGARTSLLFSSAVLTIGCFVFALSHTLIVAFVGRFFMGVGASFGFILTLYVIDVWFPPRYFAIMVGMSETLSMFGTAISAVLLAWIVTETGWRMSILICGVIGLVFFPVALIFMPKHENQYREISSKPTLQHFLKIITQLRVLLKDKCIWLVGIYAFCVFALQNVFSSLWGIPFIMESYGYSLNMATLTVMMVPVGIAVGSPIVSFISTKINQNRVVMLWGSLAGFFLITLVLYSSRLPHSLLLLLIALSGVCSSTYIQAFTIAKETSIPETRATVISLITLITMTSAVILQPFVGFLLNSQIFGLVQQSEKSNFQWSLAVLPICFFVAFIAAFLIKEPISSVAKKK